MSKKIALIFLSILFKLSIFHNAFGSEDIKIIKRSEWGADETLRYQDSPEWKNYYTNLANGSDEDETDIQKESKERINAINNYLSENYKSDNILKEVIDNENGHKLVWLIQKTNYFKSIVIHHTDTAKGMTSYEAVKSIYKFHTITRGWGDIGYNYLIGYDGEIFEGRAGGDYVVGAHAIRNNRSSLGIAVIGQYKTEKINDKQYESLKKLVAYLTQKYGIDLNKLSDYHKDCIGSSCKFYITSYKDSSLVGHRDVGNTTCPGDELYKQIQTLRSELKQSTNGLTYIKNNTITQKSALDLKLDKLSEHTLLELLAALDYKIEKTKDNKLIIIRNKVFQKIVDKNIKSSKFVISGYDKNNKISIKLSYPIEDSIKIKKGNLEYDIKVSSGKLLINDKLLINQVTLKSNSGSFLEISSWDRIPTWDTEKKYNDNKFRGELIISIKDSKLLVVNKLYLSDYLKGLGEVSDGDNIEKIKTIVIAARSYARWYMTKSIKFPGQSYQGSDNPDEFQKYLGYGLEKRSPRINKIVDETADQIITYNDDIIKPWYFSQSNGKTLSYSDYCKQNNSNCKKVNYPYLTSVFDPGSVGKTKLGHGVGISGAGATFLASKGWTDDMIIKYFLKGVSIKSI